MSIAMFVRVSDFFKQKSTCCSFESYCADLSFKHFRLGLVIKVMSLRFQIIIAFIYLTLFCFSLVAIALEMSSKNEVCGLRSSVGAIHMWYIQLPCPFVRFFLLSLEVLLARHCVVSLIFEGSIDSGRVWLLLGSSRPKLSHSCPCIHGYFKLFDRGCTIVVIGAILIARIHGVVSFFNYY